jgi:hypothetical protein
MSEIRVEALVVIGTDCTDNCKSNYHAITTTSATIPDQNPYIEEEQTTQWPKEKV